MTTLLVHPLPVVNAVSIFRNDRYRKRKVCLQSKARMPTANWPVPAIFILWFCKKLLVNLVNLVRTCSRTHCQV